MTKKGILRWIFPILLVLSLTLAPIMIWGLEKQEQAYQASRMEGWTEYLQEWGSGITSGSPGRRTGDIAIDPSGRIWVAGGGAVLNGLHVFDGKKRTSYDGSITDLAVSPEGQVWATDGRGLKVLGGLGFSERLGFVRYTNEFFGLGGYGIDQVEVDSNGRIWVTVNRSGNQQVAEIIIHQGTASAVFYHPEFTVSNGMIRSLDADDQGRIWASVRYFGFEPVAGEWAGLNFYDGKRWQHVTDPETGILDVIRTRFDDLGRAWVVTTDGDMLRYDGYKWETIDTADISPILPKDLYLDRYDRIWIASIGRLLYQDQDGWTTLTSENSGLSAGRSIFGVYVDASDRVWVASSAGVSTAAVETARTVSDSRIKLHRISLKLLGYLSYLKWYLPAVFAFLWLAVILNMLPGALMAASLGLLATLVFGSPGNQGYGLIQVIPGVFSTFAGLIGAFIGGAIDWKLGSPGSPGRLWCFILAAVGLVIGFMSGLYLAVMASL